MLDDFLRGFKDNLLDPIVRLIAERAAAGTVTPNQLSLLSLVAGILCFLSLVYYPSPGSPNWIAVLWWTTNRVLDGLDGAVARATGLATLFGGLLDIGCDLVAYCLLPVGLAIGKIGHGTSEESIKELVALCGMLSTFYVNIGVLLMLGGLLERREQEERLDGRPRSIKTALILPTGLIEGAETIVFYYLFLLMPQYLSWLFGVFAVLVAATVAQRLLWAWRHV